MNVYGGFAKIYDRMMADVSPKKWADYVELLWKTHGFKPDSVLDMACGTGRITRLFNKRGYDMTGVDVSEEMLAQARKKGGKNILYLCQDMRDFELYGTVDAIVCLCDSVNYILEEEELQKFFKLANMYLNPGGMFVFDINTKHKYSNTLKNNTFSNVYDDAAYVWENHYDKKSEINEYFVTFFAETESGLYERFEESHIQRAYSAEKTEEMLINAGFSNLSKYYGFTLEKPKKNSERIFFMAVKND